MYDAPFFFTRTTTWTTTSITLTGHENEIEKQLLCLY